MEDSLRAAGYSADDTRLSALVSALSSAELTSLEDLQFASRCHMTRLWNFAARPLFAFVARLGAASEFNLIPQEDVDFLEDLIECLQDEQVPIHGYFWAIDLCFHHRIFVRRASVSSWQ